MDRCFWTLAVFTMLLPVGCDRSDQSRTESNWEAISKYVHPEAEQSERLSLDELVDASSNGLVYRANSSLVELDRWYASKFPIYIRDEFEADSGRAGIYFETDDQQRDTMVFLFDTRMPEANDALVELLTAERIASIKEGPCLIAVVFLDDPVEAMRVLREHNETTE